MRGLLAAMTIAVMGLLPEAYAQKSEAQMEAELYCVYAALAEAFDYEAVAEAYLYDGDRTGDVHGILTEYGDACAEKHKLSALQRGAVIDFGRIGAVVDYLDEELLFAGVPGATLDKLFDIVNGLSAADYDRLFDDGWEKTSAGSVVRAKLKELAFPEDEELIAMAMQMTALIAQADDASMLYYFETGADS